MLFWFATSQSLSGWTTAQITNTKDTASTGRLAISHAYPTSTTCAATAAATTNCGSSLYPASVPTSASAAQSDAITNTGTFPGGSISSQARIASCGPVQLANSVASAPNGAMLPRKGTTFASTSGQMSGSGSIALDGTSGYASSVGSTSEPTGPALTVIDTKNYGLGIWFKTSSTSPSPLFGFGSNPLDTAGQNDRILYLDAVGKIGFVATTSGTSTAPATAPGVTKYNDGSWHFAYVSLSVTRVLVLGLSYTVTIFVDGNKVGSTGSGLLGTLTSYTGYWHVGWSPISGTARYFAGSLSDFIVDDSGNAPTSISANPTSYTSFDSSRTQQWPMNDSGGSFDGTTTGGTLPSTTTLPSSSADPCTYIDIAWAMTNPAATVWSNHTFVTAVGLGLQPISACPDPAATQTSTITLKRHTTFNAYVSGLIIYAPIQMRYSVGSWTISFIWNAAAAGGTSGSTFVIA